MRPTLSVSCVGDVGLCDGSFPRDSKQIYVNIQIWFLFPGVCGGALINSPAPAASSRASERAQQRKAASGKGWTLLGVLPVNPSLQPPPPTPLFSIQPSSQHPPEESPTSHLHPLHLTPLPSLPPHSLHVRAAELCQLKSSVSGLQRFILSLVKVFENQSYWGLHVPLQCFELTFTDKWSIIEKDI